MQQERLRLIEDIQDMSVSIGEIEYDLQGEKKYGLEQEIDYLQLKLEDELNTLKSLQSQYFQLTGQEYTETDF